ncbi:MAG: hypothetical protein ACRCYQ_06140 [Nocardioides sp.]
MRSIDAGRRSRIRWWGIVLLCVSTVATGASCTRQTGVPGEEVSSPAAETAAAGVVTSVAPGKVSGRLPADRRATAQRNVTKVVERYTDWAFLSGDYPRARWDYPAPAFTKSASEQLRRDRQLGTNADIGAAIDSVTPISRKVIVDLLAPRGRLSGAHARFAVTFDAGGDDGDVRYRVRGRLIVVPANGTWRVVGYNISKEKV